MLLLILIVWIVVIPVLVVGGLWTSATVLGRRARQRAGVDVVSLGHELACVREPEPSRPIDLPRRSLDRRPVGAGL